MWRKVRTRNEAPGPFWSYDLPPVDEIVYLKCSDDFELKGRLIFHLGDSCIWAGNGINFRDVEYWKPLEDK